MMGKKMKFQHRKSLSNHIRLRLLYCGLATVVSLPTLLLLSGLYLRSPTPTNIIENHATAEPTSGDGWTNIQVFYGEPLSIPNRPWFSQAQQDQIVVALTRSTPHLYFIDLAANDAILRSNTLALERKLQWTGLCIEPNPQYWLDLSGRKCTVIGAVIGDNSKRMESVEFVLAKKELGGIVGFDNTDKVRRKKRKFYTVPLEEVLERNNAPHMIDYLSLDIEGAELFVMENFPMDKYVIRILTIERPPAELRKLLVERGYVLIKVISTFGETLWAHKSQLDGEIDVDALKRFRFPDQVVEMRNLELMNYTEVTNKVV